jgi:uncharacterized protein YjbI with pentapeptide repeats
MMERCGNDMQIENEVFQRHMTEPASWDEHIFQFCTFSRFDAEGVHVTANFIDCKFEDCDFYLALLNGATLVGVAFRNCQFSGCAFPGCRFVECTFDNCRFTADNLGGECRFDDSRWYGSKQRGTDGLGIELAAG